MSDVHVYTRPLQPLTRFVDPHLNDRIVTHSDRALAWCHRCHTRRWASKLNVQVYYDAIYIWCDDRAECDQRRRRRRRRKV
jgi:hypothetical protein